MRKTNHSSRFIEMFGSGNWEQRPLGEVGTFKRGGGFQKSDYVEHGIPCIHYGQIHTLLGPFIYSHISEISSDLESKTKFASKGDLIIAITSEDAEGSCKSTAWLGDYPVAVGAHAAIYNHRMNPLYVSFFFKSALFNHAKMEYIHGTKVVEIRPDDIAKILVPCPPMSLQEQFSTIAEQADKSKFNSFKSRFIEMFGDASIERRIGDVCAIVSGKTIDLEKENEGGPIAYVKVADMNLPENERVVSTSSRFVSEATARTSGIIPIGATIFPKNGAAALHNKKRITAVSTCVDMNTMAVYSSTDDLLPEFLYAFLVSQDIASLALVGAIPQIRTKDVASLSIPLPSKGKQIDYIALVHQADKSKYLN